MTSRIIRSHRGTQILIDCLTSIFTLEVLKPSPEIYIISPWLGNLPVIDNNCDQFSDLFPLAESKTIYLSDILLAYAWKGSKIRLICNPSHPQTIELIRILGDKVECRVLQDNHEKGMVTHNFYIHGSMNFTYSGIYINGEKIRVTIERSKINSALIAARSRWEEAKEK